MQLSLALHIPIQEIEEYPISIINEYRALNIVSPFVNDAELIRDGLLLSLIRNQNVTEQSQVKTAEDILPYLSEFPAYLEHETIIKINSLLSVCKSDEGRADVFDKILEEVELEKSKEKPDLYLISRMTEITKQNNAN